MVKIGSGYIREKKIHDPDPDIFAHPIRVARWFLSFKPKIQIWANFGGPWMGNC
jgi:hypothetical protein